MPATASSPTSTASVSALQSLVSTSPSAVSVKQSSWAPTAKVCAGILAASVTSLLLPFWTPLTGHDMSASQAAAFTTVITFVIQYFVPERK